MDFKRPPRRRGFRWQERTKRAVAKPAHLPVPLAGDRWTGPAVGIRCDVGRRQDFPTFGTGVWWAIVTLGTVGYGDVVPHTAWGRVVGSVVIIVGVTFLSFLIATVTSYFVAAEEADAGAAEQAERTAQLAETMESLRRIEQRLAAIEAKLGELPQRVNSLDPRSRCGSATRPAPR
jgi:voltage-gated potassium channel